MVGINSLGRNPFPDQATASLDPKDQQSDSVAANVRTPQLHAAEEITDSYLDLRPVPGVEKGRILALYGPTGSGKTHTLSYLISHTAARCVKSTKICGQSYVLCGTPDLNAIRSAIIRNLQLGTLQEASRRFMAVMGREQLEARLLSTEQANAERARLRDDLPRISELIRSALINPEEVGRRQNEELRKAGDEDFKNALSYLDDEKLDKTAFAWLCGEPIEDQDRLRLGIKNPTRPPEHASDALTVILRLFNVSETPLMICLDQCEKFLQTAEGAPLLPESDQFLQWLSEKLPREKAMLALGMSAEAWQLLPTNMRERFGFNAQGFSVLSLDQAKRFLHTYILRQAPRDEEEAIISPFREDAVKEVLVRVHGNLRRFLETAHLAFKLSSTMIDATIVRQALEIAKQPPPTLGSAVAEAKSVLGERGLGFSESPKERNRARLVVKNAAGQALALVQLSLALFYDDEARQAVKSLDDAIENLFGSQSLALIIVVVGYASPEVMETLGKATRHVLIYDRAHFARQFAAALDSIPRSTSDAAVTSLQSELAALRAELKLLATERASDAEQTAIAAGGLAEGQELKRIKDVWRTARSDWAKERKTIEDQIKATRAQRLKDEVSALDRERSRARRYELREWSTILFGGLLSMDTIFLAESTFLGRVGGFKATIGSLMGDHSLLLLLSHVLVVAAFVVHFFLLPTPLRSLWASVQSIDELDQLTVRLAGFNQKRLKANLRNPNPQIRYAALRTLTPRKAEGEPVVAPEAEANVTVRRAWVWYFDASGYSIHRLNLRWPELVYFRERRGDLYRGLIRQAIEPGSPIGNAYAQGFNENNWADIRYKTSVSNIRAAVQELSPLERPGLGTFDYLSTLFEIDSLYLFFRQWMFLIDFDPPFIPNALADNP